MSELEELADDVAFLVDGRIRFAGLVNDLKKMTRQFNLERAIAHVLREAWPHDDPPCSRIARYGARDLMRSRWLLGYTGFFFLATWALLRFSDGREQGAAQSRQRRAVRRAARHVVFGTMYLYDAREFIELLLAQPVRRCDLFAGLYLGLVVPLAARGGRRHGRATSACRTSAATLRTAVVLCGDGSGTERRVHRHRDGHRATASRIACADWRLRSASGSCSPSCTTGSCSLAAMQFADYPLERPMLALMIANPIDLARLVLLLQLRRRGADGLHGRGVPAVLRRRRRASLSRAAPSRSGSPFPRSWERDCFAGRISNPQRISGELEMSKYDCVSLSSRSSLTLAACRRWRRYAIRKRRRARLRWPPRATRRRQANGSRHHRRALQR